MATTPDVPVDGAHGSEFEWHHSTTVRRNPVMAVSWLDHEAGHVGVVGDLATAIASSPAVEGNGRGTSLRRCPLSGGLLLLCR